MDTTFITIHGTLQSSPTAYGPPLTKVDLTDDAHILYSSDSIVDILGYTPDEVVNHSVWLFFHPEELPLAKAHHSRGVRLDKAAVLSYCRLKNRQGDWVGCECCFSVVYDVLVCCISIYRNGMQSQSKRNFLPRIMYQLINWARASGGSTHCTQAIRFVPKRPTLPYVVTFVQQVRSWPGTADA